MREAVGQVKRPGNSVALVAKELELGEDVLRRWVKQSGSGRWEAAPGKDLKSIQAQELERVRRELNRLRTERDSLKKALAYFAKDAA